jgi:hypothetical protein
MFSCNAKHYLNHKKLGNIAPQASGTKQGIWKFCELVAQTNVTQLPFA